MRLLLLTSILILSISFGFSQNQKEDRIEQIKKKLEEVAVTSPGLNETVDFSVTGVSIQEFLRGLAENNNINISIDPELNIKVYNNFTNEKVKNIIIFLCEEYELDVRFVGSIMSFSKYETPPAPEKPAPPHVIDIKYSSRDSLLSMDLKKDTLSSVVKKITALTGQNVILSPEIEKRNSLSLFMQNSPIKSALEKLAYALGYSVKKTEDNFYLIEPKVSDEELEANNGRPGYRKSSRRPNGSKNTGGELFYEVVETPAGKRINLESDDVPILDVITAVSRELGQDFFLFSSPKGNATSVLHESTYDDFLSHLLQGTEHTFKQNKGIYLIGEEKLEGLRATRVYQLQYRSYTDVVNIIPADLKQGVEIHEFEELNSLIMSGSEPQILEIERFITAVDKLVPMVMIEVILVDIRKGTGIETDLRLGLSEDPVTTSGSISGDGLNATLNSKTINNMLGPINLGQVDSRFYVQLKALEQSNNIKIRSTPKLSTLNGHEATLKIGQTRYYSIETQNTVGSLQPNTITTQQYNSVNADMTITIKPVVSGDDYVTLEIEVNNTDFTETVENQPPPTATSSFNSLIRIRNNEMIVLGGLERKEKSKISRGVPILSRIPVLKWFFGSHKRTNNESIMMVFIKPTILQ